MENLLPRFAQNIGSSTEMHSDNFPQTHYNCYGTEVLMICPEAAEIMNNVLEMGLFSLFIPHRFFAIKYPAMR